MENNARNDSALPPVVHHDPSMDLERLGHHIGELEPEQVDRILRDPLNLDCWALSDASGVIYASVGTSVPAPGQLVEATFSDGEAFSETALVSRGRCHIKHLRATTAAMPPYRF